MNSRSALPGGVTLKPPNGGVSFCSATRSDLRSSGSFASAARLVIVRGVDAGEMPLPARRLHAHARSAPAAAQTDRARARRDRGFRGRRNVRHDARDSRYVIAIRKCGGAAALTAAIRSAVVPFNPVMLTCNTVVAEHGVQNIEYLEVPHAGIFAFSADRKFERHEFVVLVSCNRIYLDHAPRDDAPSE